MNPINQEALQIRGIRTPCFDVGGDAREAVVFLYDNQESGRDRLDLLRRLVCRN